MLMELCIKKQIGLIVMNQAGRIRYQVIGETRGNVLLRRQQYRIADAEKERLLAARKILSAKLLKDGNDCRELPSSVKTGEFRYKNLPMNVK